MQPKRAKTMAVFLQQATKVRTHRSIHLTFSTKICFLREMVNGTTLPHENLFVNAWGVIRPQKFFTTPLSIPTISSPFPIIPSPFLQHTLPFLYYFLRILRISSPFPYLPFVIPLPSFTISLPSHYYSLRFLYRSLTIPLPFLTIPYHSFTIPLPLPMISLPFPHHLFTTVSELAGRIKKKSAPR